MCCLTFFSNFLKPFIWLPVFGFIFHYVDLLGFSLQRCRVKFQGYRIQTLPLFLSQSKAIQSLWIERSWTSWNRSRSRSCHSNELKGVITAPDCPLCSLIGSTHTISIWHVDRSISSGNTAWEVGCKSSAGIGPRPRTLPTGAALVQGDTVLLLCVS